MPPDPSLAVLTQIQSAIGQVLAAQESSFIPIAKSVLYSAIVAKFALLGLSWMFGAAGDGGTRFDALAKQMLTMATALLILTCWTQPIPGLSLSAGTFIPNVTAYLSSILDARSFETIYRSFDELSDRFSLFNPLSWLQILLWHLLAIIVLAAKVATIAVTGYGLIASSVCAILGPLFVPAMVVEPMRWLWWGFVRAWIKYSAIQLVATAYIQVATIAIRAAVESIPASIQSDLYIGYLTQAIVTCGVFVTGIAAIPLLTSSIFSGYAEGASSAAGALTARVSAMVRGR